MKNNIKTTRRKIVSNKVVKRNAKSSVFTHLFSLSRYKKSINETIKYCIAHNVLRDYLNEYKKEVCNIMTSVYDQKTATDMYGNERYAEGMQQGIQQGLQKGMLKAFVEMVKDKIITIKEAAKRLGVSETEFAKLAKI